MSKPSSKPDWTDGDAAKVEEPTSGEKLLGYTANFRPPFKKFNWLLYNITQWITYFETITDAKSVNVRTVTASGATTILTTDQIVRADCTTGDQTHNLPTAIGNAGIKITFFKVDAAHDLTIEGFGTEVINGQLNQSMVSTQQYSTITIVSNNSGWDIIG